MRKKSRTKSVKNRRPSASGTFKALKSYSRGIMSKKRGAIKGLKKSTGAALLSHRPLKKALTPKNSHFVRNLVILASVLALAGFSKPLIKKLREGGKKAFKEWQRAKA